MLGRFGWKAGVPSINQQAAEAANGDIGLSTDDPRALRRLHESEKDCLTADGNSQHQDVELGDDLFVRSIPTTSPSRRGAIRQTPRC
jgi:CxxC motif-containing protein (DUF1111 family)